MRPVRWVSRDRTGASDSPTNPGNRPSPRNDELPCRQAASIPSARDSCKRTRMNEPASGRDDVLAGREQIADIGEAARGIGLHLAHVQHDVGVGVDHRGTFVGRRDAGIGQPAECARVDTRLGGVVHPHCQRVRRSGRPITWRSDIVPVIPVAHWMTRIALVMVLPSVPHHVEARRRAEHHAGHVRGRARRDPAAARVVRRTAR